MKAEGGIASRIRRANAARQTSDFDSGPLDIARRFHPGLHARDQHGVLGIDLAVDAPVEIARRAHFAPRVGAHIGDLADQRLGRRDRHELHEVDLVGIDVEGDVRPQPVIAPHPPALLGQVIEQIGSSA